MLSLDKQLAVVIFASDVGDAHADAVKVGTEQVFIVGRGVLPGLDDLLRAVAGVYGEKVLPVSGVLKTAFGEDGVKVASVGAGVRPNLGGFLGPDGGGNILV